MQFPKLTDVIAAQSRIRPYLPPTPQHVYPAINDLLGAEVVIKHENYQPVGAFKVRGGVNLIAQLDEETRARGVIGASTGNHGQSICYAARLFGVKAIIVVPESANPGKGGGNAGHGRGGDFFMAHALTDARLHAEALTEQHGYRYIHSGNEFDLVAGVATATLELLNAHPDIDVIFVPVGAGSGACGASITAHGMNPDIEVIGVQSENAPAAYDSWKAGECVERPNNTIADGLQTAVGFELPQAIMRQELNDFMLVTDEQIQQATVWMIEHAHTLAEGAGSAALAGAYIRREELQGKKVALICSGGNISLEKLKAALAA